MSERDDYIPTMNISNTAPSPHCDKCDRQLTHVFYVRNGATLCARCRP